MAEWPGTPVAPPALQWPGTPATPNAAVAQRWPGTPASVTAPSQNTGAQQPPGAPALQPPAKDVGAPNSPQGRGIWQAIKDYPAHVLEGITSLPERAIKGAAEDFQNRGTGAEPQSVGPAVETALMTVGTGSKFMPSKGATPRPTVTPETSVPAGVKLTEAPEGGIYTPQQFKPGEKYFKALDEKGQPLAEILVKIDGKTARIEDILNPNAPREEGIGSIGNTKLREIIKQFRAQHPEVTEITGERISGARQGGEYSLLNKPAEQKVKLPEAPAAETKEAPKAEPVGALAAARNAASTIEKIFSPETVDASAKNAVSIIREASGKAARDTETTAAALEPAYKKVSAMPVQDRLDFLSYVEGRSGQYAGTEMRDPALQDLADTMRGAFEQRMRKLQAMPSKAQASFIEDYYPHFWKDPGQAQQAVQSGGMSRQGSGASLKKRTVPTIADGIAMGLEPVTTNPLEATMRYVTSMDRFIAATDVLETAKNAGTVKFIKPQVMGASGHPNSFKIPPGYKKLEGRGSSDATGGQAYAPEGFARVYNNWISRGFHDVDEALGNAYEGARRASNSITGLELGLSGYHTLTMAQESMVNIVANAVGYARAGRPIEAAKSLAKAPVAPVTYAMRGKKIQDVYLGLQPGTKHMAEVTDLLTAAGGRAKGASHSPDYEFSKT